jgi:hypothetical protein
MPFSKPWQSKLQQTAINFSLVVTTFDTLQIELHAILAEKANNDLNNENSH